MASEAEVDLLISTAGALPELERDLSRIIREAENDADAIDVAAAINTRETVRGLSIALDQAVTATEGNIDGIEVGALIDQRDALRTLDRQLGQIVDTVNRGAALNDPVLIQAVLNGPESLRDMRLELDRVVGTLQVTAPEVEVDVELDVDESKFRRAVQLLGKVGEGGRSAAVGVAPLAKSIGTLSLATGSAVPALASLVTTLLQIAPAAAVGTQAILAMQLATRTLQLATVGVGDAIERVFDPELTADEFHKSLERLAPEAALFVDQLHTMRRELRSIQQGVQNRVFRDLDEALVSLGTSAGPIVVRALNNTADSLNAMAKNTAIAAGQLAESGILGEALRGATQGLENLEQVPARLTISFATLAAGAAPAFDRITQGIDTLTLRIQDKLLRSLNDGSLQRAIDGAVSMFSQLFTIIGNFGEAAGNIFGGLTQNGGGLFDVLERISEAFVKLTASKEFQTILNELTLTVGVLVDEALPLIEEAFRQLAPVIQELAPVVRDLIKEIGPELIPVIQELGPVLVDLAIIFKEQLPFAIEVLKAVIQLLVLVLQGLHVVFQNVIIPIVSKVADILDSELVRSFKNTVSEAIKAAGGISGIFERMKASVVGTVLSMVERVVTFARDLRDKFTRQIADLVDGTVSHVRELPDRILGALFGLVGGMEGIGADAITGFANGLLGGVGRIVGIARSIADSVTSTIRGALDIRSPSKVMAKIGGDTVQGYIIGMESKAPELLQTVNGLTRVIAQFGNFDAPSSAFGTGPQITLPEQLAIGGQRPGGPISTGLGRFTLRDAQSLTRGHDQPVVNVYLGNELVNQFVNDRLRTVLNTQNRTLAQGIRI